MATSFGSEEFRIDTSQVTLVEKHVNKVERLFGVKVALDIIGGDGNQWLVVSGEKENRQKATRYIQAMCNPEQTICLKVGGRPSLDDVVLEDTERMSNSFIQRTGSLTLQLSGSELQCALAISCLEQTYSVMVSSITTAEQDMDIPAAEVLNGVKDMVVDSSPDDIQLFGSGSTAPSETNPLFPQAAQNTCHTPGKGGKTSAGTSSEPVTLNPPAVTVRSQGRKRAGADNSQKGKEIQAQAAKPSPQRAEVKDRLERGEVECESAEVQKQKSELQRLAMDMGYTQKEIEDTFSFFDFTQQEVQLHEFLTALDEVRANRVREERKGGVSPHTVGDSSKRSPQVPAVVGKTKPRKGKAGKKGEVTPPSATKPGTGRQSGNSPASPVILSPEKRSSSLDRSVIEIDEEGNSIIFMGEEADDSIHIVDPPSSAVMRHAPGRFQHPSVDAARKRKDYSDDEDQTKVLKPYVSSPNKGAADRPSRVQESIPGYPSAAAGTSSEATAMKDNSDLRFVVIDGSNVAMTHGNDKVFSCRGIKICVDYFVQRGHRVKVWVPRTKTYQKQAAHLPPVVNQEILEELREQGYLGYTPARTFNAKHIVSHDDP